MKFALVLALLSLSQAAPVKIVTRTHTAEAVTVWQTHTTNTVTVTDVPVVSSPPPGATDVYKAVSNKPETTSETTSTKTTATPETTSTTSTPVPETTSTKTTPVPETTSTKTTSTPVPETTSTSTTSTPVQTTSSPTTLTTATAPSTTSSTASAQSSSSSLNDFEQSILDEHNKKRDLHGVQHLSWDATLAEYAANYAASSFSCNNVQLIHSQGPYGENLAAGYVGGAAPVDAWYDEISKYNYDDPGFSEATGHFTQVVWKSTSKVGCAKVTCDNAWRQYTICEYSDSRGNVVGTDSSTGLSYFAENVLRPISS